MLKLYIEILYKTQKYHLSAVEDLGCFKKLLNQCEYKNSDKPKL